MTHLADSQHTAPLDEALLTQITGQGLEASVVADDDRAGSDAWLQAVSRGFLDSERNETQRDEFFTGARYRRKLGVYDPAAPVADVPVATFASWDSELSLPGGAVVPTVAISSVTVAPTHRRRGLLRSMMAGELRQAQALGYPVASLTVTESSIYGRFGFGAAAPAAQWTINTRRAGWIGPTDASGRIDFISRERGRELFPALHDRVRSTWPGEVIIPDAHWDRFLGTRADAEKPENLRVLQYTAASGDVDGLVVYTVRENHDDEAASYLGINLLHAATDEAYAALWRFILSMDLIGEVRASELSIDEPLWWMLADQRAANISLRDHHYVRVLDVAAALEARSYAAADQLVLDVVDPLGLSGGRFVLETDASGQGRARSLGTDDAPAENAPAGALAVSLGITELGSLLLGGVTPVALARAGRIETADPVRLGRVFDWPIAPRLSFWY
ncbi:GNAT family N-acetyltransferase [uncultured Microbacterium sp.]|uniref:GNAT family N-acetyltransferase n=1 Tax=uncultured Microbacterium sp. TaxID=191216 RepID=UPI0025F8E012|nr:GNAT family N-acetyltransferase [uncultured Microbacterium sp.]